MTKQSEISLALNDDFFLLKSRVKADFYSPLYGPVISLDSGVCQVTNNWLIAR